MPEGVRTIRTSTYEANVFDLLKAYAQQRQRTAVQSIRVPARRVWSLKEARGTLERLLGVSCDWAPLDRLLVEYLGEPELGRTVLASSFTASLEMAREGSVELRQAKHFAPLLIRRRNRPA
jgi:segregation and condensation protein A